MVPEHSFVHQFVLHVSHVYGWDNLNRGMGKHPPQWVALSRSQRHISNRKSGAEVAFVGSYRLQNVSTAAGSSPGYRHGTNRYASAMARSHDVSRELESHMDLKNDDWASIHSCLDVQWAEG